MARPRLTIVDAANVVGSRPDGWWRDRAGAARRLVESIRRARSRTDDTVIVLEGAGRGGAAAGDHDGVRVVHAPGSGDDQIVELVRAESAAPDTRPVTVVTSDRQLRDRVGALGATSDGPRSYLSRVEGDAASATGDDEAE